MAEVTSSDRPNLMSETQTEIQFGRTVIVHVLIEHDVAMGNVEEEWKMRRWGLLILS
jgi:hypothetical protein